MPDPRPLQTYSTLLEDRRIIETAAEAREPPSLVVHLLEKEWSIRPGRNQNINGPGGRRFSYSQPVSGLLDDIQARRIPTEFTDIFKKAEIKFFEGCLLVEMHDSRPTKGGPTKNMETRVDKYVLRPTEESLWADIRGIVDSKRGWGDKEALELEARIVLSTAPSLCLDPSPSVNRMANVIARSGADPSITSFKRKQSEDIEDDVESIKRRKLVQMMNPRFGKPFEPKFPILAARQAAQHKTEEGPPATVAKPPAPPVRQLPHTANAAVTGMPSQVAQLALQSNAQAAAIARQRLAANLRVPPDAQQAAALLQQRKNFAAHQQQLALAQAAVRNAGMASNMSNPPQNGVLPQAPINGNGNAPVIKTEQDSMAQLNSLQNTKQPFSLNMPPGAKRPSNTSIQPSSSPPKVPSAIPQNSTPQRTAQNLQMNESQQPQVSAPPASQTPRQTPATPQVLPQTTLAGSGPQAGAGQQQGMITTPAQLASYHQGLVNGQQNQMHTLVQNNPGYPNAANASMRPVYPGVANNYPMNGAVGARPPMLQQQMGLVQMNSMQQQMMQNAYQMNMGGFPPAAQGMHPNMQQQMLQIQQMHQNAAAAVAAGSIYAAASGMNMQASAAQAQAQAQQMAAFNQNIWARVENAMPKMTPEALAEMVARAPEFVRVLPQWTASNDREKARLAMYHLFKQKLISDRRQAALSAAANNQQQQQQQQQQR